MMLGLRVDVDTLNGTRQGVPALCELFRRHGIQASFFFSVGPDNMGRHIWRLLRPAFLFKMLRTKAASLYGWDILLLGTFWPGPDIGAKGAAMIRSACEDGHEIGLHAWDHHGWQAHLDTMDRDAIRKALERGYKRITDITGQAPICSAVPAWKCTPVVLEEKCRYPFIYNSDCRGQSLFCPVVSGRSLPQPQIPVTLPTYDEVIGQGGVANANFNDHLLSLIRPERLNVLTIHAEVEGGICRDMFSDFIEAALARGIAFVPLSAFLETEPIGAGCLGRTEIVGREGWVSCQTEIPAQ
jgi:undecaprenyl phosphate-alpha-L-ara4FN deformylase